MALRQHLPARQHGNDVGKIGHDAQIMLDHQDGIFRGDAFDQRRDLVDVLVAHTGHRLVQQHHLGVERERGCDLECALAPVGHLDRGRIGKLAEADIVQQLARAIVEAVEHGFGAPEIERAAVLALKRNTNVFERSEMRKHRRDLERAHQSHARDVGRRHRGDVLPLVEDFSGRRFEELGQEIKARRLPGPIRADQRVNAPTADLEGNIADGEKSRELLGQPFRFENELIGQTNFPLPARRAGRAWLCLFLSAFRKP